MLTLSPWLTAYLLTLTALLGGCIGSFLNCMAWRIVHGESVVKGRSHCDACGHLLSGRDLVPVFSFLFAKGKCRYCGAKLSRRHPVAELVTAVVFLAFVLKYDISFQALGWILWACLLLGCAFADLEGYIIPDRFILSGVVLRVVFWFVLGEDFAAAVDALLGGLAVGGGLLAVVLLFEWVRKKEGMGGGDLKLFFLTGLFLGWQGNLLCLILACLVGIGSALFFLRGKSGETPFPFGPSIVAAAIFTALFGSELIQWYIGLIF